MGEIELPGPLKIQIFFRPSLILCAIYIALIFPALLFCQETMEKHFPEEIFMQIHKEVGEICEKNNIKSVAALSITPGDNVSVDGNTLTSRVNIMLIENGLLREQAFETPDTFTPEKIAQLGKTIQAEAFILGVISIKDDIPSAELKIIRSDNSSVIWMGTVKPKEKKKKEKGKKLICVIDFDNNSIENREKWESLRQTIAKKLITDLSNIPEIGVIPYDRVQMALGDTSALIKTDIAKMVAIHLEADYLVAGSFTCMEKEIMIDASIMDVVSATMVKGESVSGETDKLLKQILPDLSKKISDDIRVLISDTVIVQKPEPPAPSATIVEKISDDIKTIVSDVTDTPIATIKPSEQPQPAGPDREDESPIKDRLIPACMSCVIPGLGQLYANDFHGVPKKTIGHCCCCLAGSIFAPIALITAGNNPTIAGISAVCSLLMTSLNIWSAYDAYTGREDGWFGGYF